MQRSPAPVNRKPFRPCPLLRRMTIESYWTASSSTVFCSVQAISWPYRAGNRRSFIFWRHKALDVSIARSRIIHVSVNTQHELLEERRQ